MIDLSFKRRTFLNVILQYTEDATVLTADIVNHDKLYATKIVLVPTAIVY